MLLRWSTADAQLEGDGVLSLVEAKRRVAEGLSVDVVILVEVGSDGHLHSVTTHPRRAASVSKHAESVRRPVCQGASSSRNGTDVHGQSSVNISKAYVETVKMGQGLVSSIKGTLGSLGGARGREGGEFLLQIAELLLELRRLRGESDGVTQARGRQTHGQQTNKDAQHPPSRTALLLAFLLTRLAFLRTGMSCREAECPFYKSSEGGVGGDAGARIPLPLSGLVTKPGVKQRL